MVRDLEFIMTFINFTMVQLNQILCIANGHHGFPDRILQSSETKQRQERKDNKATKGNTLSRAKVLPEHRKNAKEFPLCLDHIFLKTKPQEAAFETLNGIYNFL